MESYKFQRGGFPHSSYHLLDSLGSQRVPKKELSYF